MDDTRHVTTPEELHSELREGRKEIEAEAEAAMAEFNSEIATEAAVRAGVQIEEADRWGGVSMAEAAIHEVMTRAVAEIHVREELEKKLRSGRKLRIKLGIDPTGPRLHLGRSVPLFKMRQFQDLGHQVVLIIGDFTALVGDASDKDALRPMLTREQIEQNMATYKEQIGRILDLDRVEFRYNSEWLRPLNFGDVIRLASKFTVAQMIQRENFSERWESGKPIGLHELLYPLMQGFDSIAIEADVELGGTDQLFNLMSGRALQEDFEQPPQSVLCTNMIPGTDGRKMSTSWGNSIYILDEPRDQFGKIMSMQDHVIPVFMESCTRIPMEEVQRVKDALERLNVQTLERSNALHPMDAKKRLAWEIVNMYHGEEAANAAQRDFEKQFQERGLPTDVPTVSLERALSTQHSALSTQHSETGEVGILDLLINVGLAPNRKHAQRLVEQGGVRVVYPGPEQREERVTGRDHRIKPVAGMVLRAGRSFVRVED